MIDFLRQLVSPWVWRMAWRDSRPARWRLLLFSSSIVFGVAALATIGSLRENLNSALGGQAKSLLGADLMVASREPFSAESENLLADFRRQSSDEVRELSFTSMVGIADEVAPKLVTLRGVEPAFPFFGSVVTEPAAAWQQMQAGGGIIVEPAFLASMNASVGDLAKVGSLELPVLGVVKEAPPSASGFSALSPTVFISLEKLESTGLAGMRSLAFHRAYFQLNDGVNAEQLVEANGAKMAELKLTQTTAESRSENVEQAIDYLYLFLNLVGISALFLGGIGVAGAIHVHVSERLASVATLRCLGCSAARSFAVYFVQCVALGFIGVGFGLLLAWVNLLALGAVLANYFPAGLPFGVQLSMDAGAFIQGGLMGVIVSTVFALLPLLAVRRVSPLAAIRKGEQFQSQGRRDPLRWLIYTLMVAVVFFVAWFDSRQLERAWIIAGAYIGFLLLAFGVFAAVGLLLRKVCRWLMRPSWPFVLRQGVAALYRPNNQTGLFMMSIGMGVFFMLTLICMQNILNQWLDPERMAEKPNLFFVDVPPGEMSGVSTMVAEQGATPLGNAPIVSMRITDVKGVGVRQLASQGDASGHKIPAWVVRREFRSTYRDQLGDSEEMIAGEWISSWSASQKNEAIPVSLEQKMADDLGVVIGDELSISIEGFGVSLPIRVANLREVDWRSLNLNFFMIFPPGVLDDYVSYDVMTAHSAGPEITADVQKALFEKFPYVNTIDVSLILSAVQQVLAGASRAVQAMAMLTVLTGALVLVALVLAGRRVRIRESVLLRTMGASRRQITQVLASEYILLSSMAVTAGAGLSVIACYLLGMQVFQGEAFVFPWLLMLATSVGFVIVIVSLGMLLSRGIAKRPPLEVLRSA